MFTIEELQVLLGALKILDIKGGDAKFIASLQTKLEQKIIRIQEEIKAGPPELQDKKEDKKPVKK